MFTYFYSIYFIHLFIYWYLILVTTYFAYINLFISYTTRLD